MANRKFFPFSPERIFWIGAAVLIASAAGGFIYLWNFQALRPISACASTRGKKAPAKRKNLSVSLGGKESSIQMPAPSVSSEMIFSCYPPRPHERPGNPDVLVRLRSSSESKRVSLPCRLDLRYSEEGVLQFAPSKSLFWLDLSAGKERCVEAACRIETLLQGIWEAEKFTAPLQESPLRTSKEFPEGSPFRVLAEARWLGQNVFSEKCEKSKALHRISVDPLQTGDILEIEEGSWMAWQEGKWIKLPSKDALNNRIIPMARIEAVNSKTLILEGWNGEQYVRLALALSALPPFKIRIDEVFNSIRIRSEKQISCMMEKQCLILKCGDWVLKSDDKWKVLRKHEEREAYRTGEMAGELFVFENIEIKQGQKFIRGRFFNTEKTQTVSVDAAASRRFDRKDKGSPK